jgi:hypothetical protein
VARAFAYCLKRAPEPKWAQLGRHVEHYGIEAVFGRSVLYEYEMDAMLTSRNIIKAFRARAASDNWAEWEKNNHDLSEILVWAAAEFYKRENDG